MKLKGWFRVIIDYLDDIVGELESLLKLTKQINRKVDQMGIDQATFDTDLAGLVSAVQAQSQTTADLVAAVDSFITAHPEIDFAAEDANVLTAAQAVQASTDSLQGELNKLNPAAPPAPAS